jgi:hypothetical protein
LGREIGPKAADRVQGDGSERRRKSMPGASGRNRSRPRRSSIGDNEEEAKVH